ncbi:hypothetical protein [Methylomonas sp. Kb3]|uniref:hypothetical protein n=1 Tax=Methylomonas sp. Kb3 TaxID=1611544 RepID=UPI0013FD43CF|nr:hypothetical protein [Methylomonas sp. Kb3]
MTKFEWAKQIDRLSPVQIEQGIQGCIDSGEKYPPTLPLFVKYAKTEPEILPKSRRKVY